MFTDDDFLRKLPTAICVKKNFFVFVFLLSTHNDTRVLRHVLREASLCDCVSAL